MTGDQSALGALARNLADNAVRYSPPGSRVELRVALDDRARRRCRWTTPAPAFPPANANAYSTASTAAATHDEAGSGLGLAIVRSVAGAARRHGSRWRDSPLGGLRVRVQFPAAAGAP